MSARMAIALVLLAAVSAAAQSPAIRDFAYGVQVEADGDGAIYHLAVPEPVYRDATRSDLGDLRVFNQGDEVLPHALRVPTAATADAEEPRLVPFFPLLPEAALAPDGVAIDIVTDGTGAIIHVGKGGATAQPPDPVGAYLIDASGLDRSISALNLQWESPGERFVITVAVEASDDLTRWHTVVGAATLADVRYREHRLEQRHIAVPDVRAKYFRLSWPDGVGAARVTRVSAALPPVSAAPSRQWAAMSSVRASAQPLTYEFARVGVRPVDRVTIRLPHPNSVVDAVVKSRADASAPWQVRARGLLYSLDVNGITLVNDPFSLAPTADRYWSLEVRSDDNGLGDGTPVLEVGWVPHDLYFLARGEPPYRLAFGSAVVGPPDQSVDALLRAIDDRHQTGLIAEARIGSSIELGGPDRLLPPPLPFPWTRWVLWGVLIGSVGLLGWMARRLYREMNPPGAAPGPQSGMGPG